jgi:hypothetical protein
MRHGFEPLELDWVAATLANAEAAPADAGQRCVHFSELCIRSASEAIDHLVILTLNRAIGCVRTERLSFTSLVGPDATQARPQLIVSCDETFPKPIQHLRRKSHSSAPLTARPGRALAFE